MDTSTLERARTGDDQAFRALTDPYRRELQVHCYRILGSLTDAEDMLQETLLAAWRALPAFQERSSLRTWLYRIATNQCLNALRSATRRAPEEPTPPFTPPEPTHRGEITWLQPYPDTLLEGIPDTAPDPEARYQLTESVELAFITSLQRMPPRQAATLVLRDVLAFTTEEVATLLNTTPTAIKGTLQRARASLNRTPDRPQPPEEQAIARRFADAFTAADIDAILSLLTDDAWLAMPPAPHEYHGLPAIAEFLHTSFTYRAHRQIHLIPTKANTHPAFATYVRTSPTSPATPAGLFVLTFSGPHIQSLIRFHLDTLYSHFDLPTYLP